MTQRKKEENVLICTSSDAAVLTPFRGIHLSINLYSKGVKKRQYFCYEYELSKPDLMQ